MDRAQLNLSSQYQATGDQRIQDFMQRFGTTIDTMTKVGIDELYPLPPEELAEDASPSCD
jgi:hypothetical protein